MMPVPGPGQLRAAARAAQGLPRLARRDRRQASRPAQGVRLHEPFRRRPMLEQTAKTVKEGGFVGLIVNTSVRASTSTPTRRTRSSRWPPSSTSRSFCTRRPSQWAAAASRDYRLVEQVGRFYDVTVGFAGAGVRRPAGEISEPEVHRGDGRRRHHPAAEPTRLAYQPRHWSEGGGQGRVAMPGAGGARRGESATTTPDHDPAVRKQDHAETEHLRQEVLRRHRCFSVSALKATWRRSARSTCCSARIRHRSRHRSRKQSAWSTICRSRRGQREDLQREREKNLQALSGPTSNELRHAQRRLIDTPVRA